VVAEAREITQGRRACFYRLDVATEDGRMIASAQAVAHRRTS
jgi:acyl-coenzyme A thioesterase PaaI-like protein